MNLRRRFAGWLIAVALAGVWAVACSAWGPLRALEARSATGPGVLVPEGVFLLLVFVVPMWFAFHGATD